MKPQQKTTYKRLQLTNFASAQHWTEYDNKNPIMIYHFCFRDPQNHCKCEAIRSNNLLHNSVYLGIWLCIKCASSLYLWLPENHSKIQSIHHLCWRRRMRGSLEMVSSSQIRCHQLLLGDKGSFSLTLTILSIHFYGKKHLQNAGEQYPLKLFAKFFDKCQNTTSLKMLWGAILEVLNMLFWTIHFFPPVNKPKN